MISETVQAIVAGSVLAVAFLLTLLVVIACFLYRRRKNHKKREHKKAHPVSDHASPTHSQPSTLGNITNGSLPRVSSTGLWMDTPSVYAVPPSQNYYYPHPHSYGMYGKEHTFPMSRAISESRIPQPGLQYVPHRPQFGNQNGVYLLPVPSQRFYHSQHLAPVYEMPPSRGMEIYDYPFSVQNGGYRSKLLEARHTPEYYSNMSEFIMKPRVERSKSISEDRPPAKHQQKKDTAKQVKVSAQVNGRIPSSMDSKNHRSSWADEERKQLKSSNGSADGRRANIDNVHGIHSSKAFSSESVLIDRTTIPHKVPPTFPPAARLPQQHGSSTRSVSTTVRSSENIPSTETDSMKLLAKNKTDDQKTQPSFSSLVEEKNIKHTNENDSELNLRQYTYEGSIYAVPKRDANDSDYDNPIVNRIKDMVTEKIRSSNTASPVAGWKNHYEGRISNNSLKAATSAVDNPYEVSKVTTVTTTTVTESYEPIDVSDRNSTAQQTRNNIDNRNSTAQQTRNNIDTRNSTAQQTRNNIDVVDGLFLPDISDLDKDYNVIPSPRLQVQNSITRAPKINQVTDLTSHLSDKSKDDLSPRWSLDNDSGVDDINKAGKHIASTAFQFLDSYLSDDEGTESLVESPPLSPGGLKAGKVY